MAMKHNSGMAKRFLKLIVQTKRPGAPPVSFACGTLGKDAKVVLVSRKAPNAAQSQLKAVEWGDLKGPKQEGAEYKALSFGLAQLDGTTLTLKFKKPAGAAALSKGFREYFKGNFKLSLVWGKLVAKPLSDAEEARFVEMSDDDGDLVDDMELQRLGAEAEQAGEEAVDETAPDDAGSDAEPPEPQASANDGNEAVPPLPPAMQAHMKDEVLRITRNAMRVAAGSGMTREVADEEVAAKLEAWLSGALAATPPEEREARLTNFLARLSLMLSFTENAENVQALGPARRKTAKAPAKTASGGASLIPGSKTDLAGISHDEVSWEEVADALFEEALAIGMTRQDRAEQLAQGGRQRTAEGDRAHADHAEVGFRG